MEESEKRSDKVIHIAELQRILEKNTRTKDGASRATTRIRIGRATTGTSVTYRTGVLTRSRLYPRYRLTTIINTGRTYIRSKGTGVIRGTVLLVALFGTTNDASTTIIANFIGTEVGSTRVVRNTWSSRAEGTSTEIRVCGRTAIIKNECISCFVVSGNAKLPRNLITRKGTYGSTTRTRWARITRGWRITRVTRWRRCDCSAT